MGRQMSVVRSVEHLCRRDCTQGNRKQRPVSGMETAKAKPVTLDEIAADDEPRIDLHDAELNRVLGGGLVQGSLVLIGGEPGIGKSTLVLQTILRIPEKRILYISGEESARQLKAACRPSVRHIRRLPDCLRNLVGTDLRPHKEYTPRFSHNRLHTDHLHRDARILSRQHSPGERMLRLYPALRQRNAYGGHPHRPYQQGRKHCRA